MTHVIVLINVINIYLFDTYIYYTIYRSPYFLALNMYTKFWKLC